MSEVREPIEMEVALRGAEGSRELVQELAQILLDQLPGSLAAIQAAIAAQDSPALKRQAHQLAGGLGLFGAQPALEAARTLETAAETASWQQIPVYWSHFETEIARLQSALTQLAK